MTELDDVNSLAETAAYLKFTEPKVVQLAQARKLAGIKEGRTWIFPRQAITDYLEQNLTQVVPDSNPWGLTDRSLARARRSA